MIQRLRIRNYKSIREIDLALSPIVALVGRNNAGKSNVVDALSFVRDFIHPKASGTESLYSALADRAGLEEVLFKGGDEKFFEIEIELAVAASIFRYRVRILGGLGGYASVADESLQLKKGDRFVNLTERAQAGIQMVSLDGSRVGGYATNSRSVLSWANPDWVGFTFCDAVLNWRFNHLLPPLMRRENKTSEGQFLLRSGENLSAWLLWLQTRRQKTFKKLTDTLRDLLPELVAFTTWPSDTGHVHLAADEVGLNRPISVVHMSDGELAMIALLSLIYACADTTRSSLFLEEPENYLHPHMLASFIRLAQQAVRGNDSAPQLQMFCTTHSPLLLDQLELHDIVWIEKRDGATGARKAADYEHLRTLVGDPEIGLGDLVYSGSLEQSR